MASRVARDGSRMDGVDSTHQRLAGHDGTMVTRTDRGTIPPLWAS